MLSGYVTALEAASILARSLRLNSPDVLKIGTVKPSATDPQLINPKLAVNPKGPKATTLDPKA